MATARPEYQLTLTEPQDPRIVADTRSLCINLHDMIRPAWEQRYIRMTTYPSVFVTMIDEPSSEEQMIQTVHRDIVVSPQDYFRNTPAVGLYENLYYEFIDRTNKWHKIYYPLPPTVILPAPFIRLVIQDGQAFARTVDQLADVDYYIRKKWAYEKEGANPVLEAYNRYRDELLTQAQPRNRRTIEVLLNLDKQAILGKLSERFESEFDQLLDVNTHSLVSNDALRFIQKRISWLMKEVEAHKHSKYPITLTDLEYPKD